MPLAFTGSLTAVQFCYPAELPLNLNKNEHFSKVAITLAILTKYLYIHLLKIVK